MTCTSIPCGSTGTGNSVTVGTAGRETRVPVANYWPNHEKSVLTNFISERNRVATMWKL